MTKEKSEIIHYCKCGQAVRLRKRDNIWVHYGYHRQFEPYSEFLERTNHIVEIVKSIDWSDKSEITVVEWCSKKYLNQKVLQ